MKAAYRRRYTYDTRNQETGEIKTRAGYYYSKKEAEDQLRQHKDDYYTDGAMWTVIISTLRWEEA